MINQHIPVLMREAIDALNVRDNLDYIDVTFGGGSYSEEILKKADCNLLSLDKDPTVKNYAKKLKVKYKKGFTFVSSPKRERNLELESRLDFPIKYTDFKIQLHYSF